MHRFILALAALCAAGSALADVKVEDAWVRATVPGQRTSGAFMQLTASSDVTLVAARSPTAGVVELHEMAMDDQATMRMRQVPGIALPAGKPVTLKPGGYHVMLMGLKETLLPGRKLRLTLVTRDSKGETDEVDLEVPVRPMNTATQHQHQH
jgi:copper(I)-binding protein